MKSDKQLIKALTTWGETRILIFNKETGKFYEVESVARGLGMGILFTVGKEVA